MPILDKVIALALAGSPAESELQAQRAVHERSLSSAKRDLEGRLADVHRLHFELRKEETSPLAKLTTENERFMAALVATTLSHQMRRAKAMRDAFRVRHGLTRMPRLRNVLEGGLFVALLVFIEGGANSTFFLSAHMASGPMAALLAALVISLVNVALSCAGGFYIGRYLNYGRNAPDADDPAFKKRRQMSRWLTGGFIAVIGLFHLTVGMIRAQETFEIEHSFGAYLNVLATPESLFLVLLGAVMSTVSWFKGMHAFDDPYPEYGATERAVDEAMTLVQDAYDDFAEQIEEAFDEAASDIDDLMDEHADIRAKYNDAVAAYGKAAHALVHQVAIAESQLRANAATMVELYEAVRREREEEVSPEAVTQNATPPETLIEKLVSFQHYLPEPVEFAPVSAANFEQRHQHVNEARAKAFEQLDATFQRAFDPKTFDSLRG